MTEQEREYRTERMVRAMAECNSLTLECKTTGQIARRLRMTYDRACAHICADDKGNPFFPCTM